jgi:hypothetical protein
MPNATTAPLYRERGQFPNPDLVIEWLDVSWAALECGAARVWKQATGRDGAEHETAKHSRSSLEALMRVGPLVGDVAGMLSLALMRLSLLASCSSGEDLTSACTCTRSLQLQVQGRWAQICPVHFLSNRSRSLCSREDIFLTASKAHQDLPTK